MMLGLGSDSLIVSSDPLAAFNAAQTPQNNDSLGPDPAQIQAGLSNCQALGFSSFDPSSLTCTGAASSAGYADADASCAKTWGAGSVYSPATGDCTKPESNTLLYVAIALAVAFVVFGPLASTGASR